MFTTNLEQATVSMDHNNLSTFSNSISWQVDNTDLAKQEFPSIDSTHRQRDLSVEITNTNISQYHHKRNILGILKNTNFVQYCQCFGMLWGKH